MQAGALQVQQMAPAAPSTPFTNCCHVLHPLIADAPFWQRSTSHNSTSSITEPLLGTSGSGTGGVGGGATSGYAVV